MFIRYDRGYLSAQRRLKGKEENKKKHYNKSRYMQKKLHIQLDVVIKKNSWLMLKRITENTPTCKIFEKLLSTSCRERK